MRVLGLDLGAKRIGLAISDPSRTLARPLATLSVSDDNALESVLREVERLSAEDDGLSAIVVGVPRRMDGSESDASAAAIAFITALGTHTAIPVVAEDERMSSREAESRLAVNERDWRKRKRRLDAAAAAVILQDYLDRPHE
jgi:putative Holliday junction resolvase